MKIYHFVLALASTAAAGKTTNLRKAEANDLSASDTPCSLGTAPINQQTIEKPQCAFDVASLNRGDVQIELPGGNVY